ncbi:hypothetical protein SAMD00023353_2200830 [Rosellinia necatrix]|uniref:Uncharacterized protein n=1 Tax=Rosellinia necatrix TaxID=77044 RepID=A0A1S8A802_ROSNE|nr:hypothetical protein SAMD00023353_2200830 [Rosellinia necatrix]
MHALSCSPLSRPKGILKKPSTLDLHMRPRSFSEVSKKSTAFDDIARDIVTGAEVPQSPVPSSEYRAFHKEYRQEAGRALLLAKIDGMYDDVVRRLDIKVEP